MGAVETYAERLDWCRRYQTSMRRFLRQGKSASPLPAARLGRRAVTLGLETLDVATLHEQTLTALTPPGGSSRTTRHKTTARAKVFFAEVIAPIEATHRAALKAEARIDQLTRTLRRRRNESSVSAKRLQRAVAQRQVAEVTLKKGADQQSRLLIEAGRLQDDLRHQMRAILSAQEDERQKASRALRNEIAQALIAIDLSLLRSRTSDKSNTEKLEMQIDNAQRLAAKYTTAGF